MYNAPDESMLQALRKMPIDPKFNLMEWWEIAEGEKLSKLFNVGEELVPGLLWALAIVGVFFYLKAS